MPARTANLPALGDPAGAASLWVWTARRGQVRRLLRRPGSADALLPRRDTALADWWRQLPPSLARALQHAWQRLHSGARQTRLHWQAGSADTACPPALVGTAWLWQLDALHAPDGRLVEVSGWVCPAPEELPGAASGHTTDPTAGPGHPSALQAQRSQLAEISHELRTPLNAILGFCALAQTAPDDAQALRPALRQIDQAAQLMRQVVDDLLDLERLDAGALSLAPPQPVSVSGLLSRVLALAAGLPMRSEVALHAQLAADVPTTVLADGQRLAQVLLNLVANALRHTDSGLVQVSVRLRQASAAPSPAGAGAGLRCLRFSVSDTGVGMGLGDLSRLAQPQAFGQVGDDLQRRRSGSGLGLVVVQRLLALQGSRLQVASMPGGGTTVWFDLNLADGHDDTDSHTDIHADAGPGVPATTASPLPCTALICTRDPRLAATLAVQWQAQGQRLSNHSPEELGRLAGVALGQVAHWLVDSRLPADTLHALQAAAQASGVRLWAVHPCPLAVDGGPPDSATAPGAALGIPPGTTPSTTPALARLYAPLAGRTVLCSAATAQATPPLGAGHALPVLVVEDNLLNQRVFQGQLARLGLRCQIAGSLADARRLCASQAFAAALVDRELPDGQGLDLLLDWQQQPAVRRWPVVLTSAHFEPEHLARARRLGAQACLLKPLDAGQLRALLVQAGVLAAGQETGAGAGRRHTDSLVGADQPDLMPLFLRERAALLAPVEAAWAAGDRATLGRAVHALHGALALLPPRAGQAPLALVRRVVQGLQQPDLPPLPTLPVPALVQAVRALQAALV